MTKLFKEIIENNKENIAFRGGSMLPVDVNCLLCPCIKTTCEGIIYEGSCILNTINPPEDYDVIYYALEKLKNNNYSLAKCFGVNLQSEDIVEGIENLKNALDSNISTNSKQEFQKCIDNYHIALETSNEEIDNFINQSVDEIYNM